MYKVTFLPHFADAYNHALDLISKDDPQVIDALTNLIEKVDQELDSDPNNQLVKVMALDARAEVYSKQEDTTLEQADLEEILYMPDLTEELEGHNKLAYLRKRGQVASELGKIHILSENQYQKERALELYCTSIDFITQALNLSPDLAPEVIDSDSHKLVQIGLGRIYQQAAVLAVDTNHEYNRAVDITNAGIEFIKSLWDPEPMVLGLDPEVAKLLAPLRTDTTLQRVMRSLTFAKAIAFKHKNNPDLDEAYRLFVEASGFEGHYNAALLCVDIENYSTAETHYATAVALFSNGAPTPVHLSNAIEGLACLRDQDPKFTAKEFGISFGTRSK